MASETASLVETTTVSEKTGKHRILAELKRLDQDIKFLQEELEELEKADNVSIICIGIHGAVNVLWDRWFEGPQEPHECTCLIL
ncbi:guanine nucleotide-binding protein subunit gamma 2 isoform X2 [Arachis hypogaea]|uniref:guanine nucleotide-binding protein subunit gamma 2 isoform X2 n=1 Tax=Arachis hypogaea TaxID=3818 RepID=UPI0034E81262